MKIELFGDVGEFGEQSNFIFDVPDAGRYRNSSHLTDRVSLPTGVIHVRHV
jgi:hypothetical protein